MRISQREARRMRKRLATLEQMESHRRNAWVDEYPGGVNIATYTGWGPHDEIPVALRTARKLKHAVVVIAVENGDLRFFALPIAGAKS